MKIEYRGKGERGEEGRGGEMEKRKREENGEGEGEGKRGEEMRAERSEREVESGDTYGDRDREGSQQHESEE